MMFKIMELFINLTIFIFGISIGSFLNILIDRLPKDESINGRSHCDFCGKKLAVRDLIPVLSFFILGGKTRCCKKKLSWQYPIVEAITGLVFVAVVKNGLYLESLTRSIVILSIFSCLVVIFVSDLKYRLISDYIQAVFFISSFIYHLLSNNFISLFLYFFISSLVVALPIFLVYYLSRERAMGLGDVFLSFNIGFLLGWQAGFLALYIAFVTGAVFGSLLILLKRKKIKSKIAFGPFLLIGTVVMMFWGEKIIEGIKRMYGF